MAVRDVVQAAAGVGGGDKLYVEDVFSTYLYTGNGATQTIENGIALGDSNYGPSVEFDGTSDYLSRSSDLTGNTDGKTLTFSGWFYTGNTATQMILHLGEMEFTIKLSSATTPFRMVSGNGVLDARITSMSTGNLNTWNHVLISLDMGNTGNRYVYVNDVAATVNWVTYVNSNLDRTSGSLVEVGAVNAGSKLEGKLSNLFVDYTYRDLSVTNNRRLFITADGQPATGQASLSPILYMPFDGSTATVGANSGTGGDFTVNGSPTVLTQGGPYTEAGYGKGGMVWSKARNNSGTHRLNDSVRGVSNGLRSDSTAADQTVSNGITAFNSDGYALGTDSGNSGYNFNNYTYASWTFRKAEKFFDVVTWTGDGVAGREIAHSLDSVPGMVIVKNLSVSSDWAVWHRSLTSGNYILLNSTAGQTSSYASLVFGNNSTTVDPTSTQFTVGTGYYVNAYNETYVAYVFAHDAGGFGDDGEQNVISCGSYTEDWGTGVQIELGWEPQWVMVKSLASGGSWQIYDNMRNTRLLANASNAEFSNSQFTFNATGFNVNYLFQDNSENIYIAIRRPMKTPESGTEVFSVQRATDSGTSTTPEFITDWPVDLSIYKADNVGDTQNSARLITGKRLKMNSTVAEDTSTNDVFDFNNGTYNNALPSSYIGWMFKRAPSFMDVVAYEGTGAEPRTVYHNLGVAPEMIWTKRRDSGGLGWVVWHKDLATNTWLRLDSTQAETASPAAWGGTFSADTYTIANDPYNAINGSGGDLIAYLFATLPGVSKVGSYTGTGANLNVDCGFSAGARFILIKRIDSTGDWYVWDSVRGIVAGNDPYLLLNTTAAQVTNTDYIDPLASGFTVTSTAPAALNASGGNYLFMAIA